MNKVRKLTPATLKRIIAEEKLKLKKQSLRESRKSKKMSDAQLVESYMKILKMLKSKQLKSVGNIKKLEEARKLIKNKLLKRL